MSVRVKGIRLYGILLAFFVLVPALAGQGVSVPARLFLDGSCWRSVCVSIKQFDPSSSAALFSSLLYLIRLRMRVRGLVVGYLSYPSLLGA